MTQDGENQEIERIGDVLRRTREARGISLGEISEQLLIRKEYLESIERMYAGGVPNGYINGFLRSYSGYLDLDPDHVIRTFNAQCGAVSEAPKMEAVVAENERNRNTARAAFAGLAGVLAVAVVGGLGYAVFQSLDGENGVETAAAVNGARASLFAEVEETDELEPQLPLTLTAVRQGWIEVRGSDGTVFRSRAMAAGEVYHPRIGAGWTVSARDGAAFIWHLGDVEIGPLGEDPAAVYAISVDTVAQVAQDIAAPALAAVGESQPSR
ncbi:MAG: helix-turn-helix domain-containing protein [Pseudomonadota bacterium]